MIPTAWTESLAPAKVLKRLGGVWFLGCSLIVWREGGFSRPLTGSGIPLLAMLGGLLLGFVLLTLLGRRFPHAHADDYLLVCAAPFYGWSLVWHYTGQYPWSFCVAVLAALFLVLAPLFRQKDWKLLPLPVGRKWCLTAFTVCGVLFIAVVGAIGCLRYRGYLAPNFDFGVFTQMFHNMRESFLPITTCERNGLLSHFAVHISPIFYLLLPFYALFPSPLTLQIGQAVVVASGLLPLYFLARRYGLSHKATAGLALIYAGYPVLSAGCFYDLHENCFLVPLLLWLFAAFEYGRYPWMYAAAVGVLLVKEDAAVYVLLFAVYLLIVRRQRRHGLFLSGLALGYFAAAVGLLYTFGEGVMAGRYANLMEGDSGLAGLVATLLRNPGFFLTQLFRTSDRDAGKWLYLLQLLLPLGLVPLFCRRHGRFLLLAPVLLGLLTTYAYQYNIGFQYSFGVAAFLLYLLIMNLADFTPFVRRGLLAFSAAAACLTFTAGVLPELEKTAANYVNNRSLYRQMDAILETVPQEASVTASCMLVPHLTQRAEIYETFYHPQPDTDYVVLDMRPGYQKDALEYRAACVEAGYTPVGGSDDVIEILKGPGREQTGSEGLR